MGTAGVQFDKVAEEYDFAASLLNDHSFFLSNMPLKKGTALDIGCGTGLLAHELSGHFDHVIGIDLSNEMLEIARRKRRVPNTEYLKMDANDLRFSGLFDFIVSRTTFHHLEDVPNVICRMKELLHPGGKIVIIDNVSEVETPPAYVYVLGAIREFFPNCFTFGIKSAARVFRHQTSKPWLEHLAADKYLSEQAYYDLYGPLLPGCTFRRMGWAMGIVWENKPIGQNGLEL
ncbi:class I SAM-dependent methyltransferase [Bacillus sp. JJ675]|uniref:class I SAM-dependent methyltransferase n=1 Tax=Bacillus sp. JJ675 TaxID=3122972 RepID=UPI00300041FC